MDQMVMSQGMYGGFGGQGMGMNGMNSMNIGMGYNAGQNAFGGFNGQPAAWNAGHDKFNQNAYGHATGMGGEFGTNAGYGRYNMPQHQGNFNQMNHHQYQNNDFQIGYNGQGFQNRGRGRGRGYQNAGRGRGGYHQVNHGNQANYEPFHHQIPQQLTQQEPSVPQPSTDIRKTPEQLKLAPTNPPPTPDKQSSTQQAAEDLAKELEPGDAKDALEKDAKASPAEASSGENFELVTKAPENTTDDTKQHGAENPDPVESEKPFPIEAFVPSHSKEPDIGQVNGIVKAPAVMMPPPTPAIPLGPAALYSVDQQQDSPLRGGGAGRGLQRGGHGYHNLSRGRSTSYGSNSIVTPLPSPKPIPTADTTTPAPVELKGLGVEGAPKAPKALRDGLPNTGLRGRGFSIVGRASSVTQARPNGHTRSRRYVSSLNLPSLIRIATIGLNKLLSITIVPRQLAQDPLPDINHISIVLIVTGPQVVRVIAIATGGASATVATRAITKMLILENPMIRKAQIREKNRQNRLPEGPLTEVTESTERPRTQVEAVTALTGHTETAVGAERGSPGAAGSDQNPLEEKQGR